MPLDPIVDSVEDLPEALQSEYVQQEDGKYLLAVNPKEGYALENTSGLKSALGKERARATQLAEQVSKYGEIDPAEITQKLQRLEELEQIDPSREADKLLANEYLRKSHIDDRAKSAILKAGGTDKTLTYMLPHVINQLSVQETDQGFITQVRDEFGNPRIADASGAPMTVEQLVMDMKSMDLWASAFPGTATSGGGMPANTQGGTPASSTKVDLKTMSSKEKSELIAKNPEKWMELLSNQS